MGWAAVGDTVFPELKPSAGGGEGGGSAGGFEYREKLLAVKVAAAGEGCSAQHCLEVQS